jgi:hypothetical protein
MILKNTPIIFPKNIKLVSLKNPGSSKNKSIFSAKLKHFESQNEKSIAPAQSFVHPKMKNPTINLFSFGSGGMNSPRPKHSDQLK